MPDWPHSPLHRLGEAGAYMVTDSTFKYILGRQWPLDRYAEMVARTTTCEAMTQGTINRLREHGITLAQVSVHNAEDFCRYYENTIVSLNGPHPVATLRSSEAPSLRSTSYPPISAINGGPPFHPRCVHVLTPFVERLATDEEKKRGIISSDLLSKSPAELQRRFRKEFPDIVRRAGRRQQGRSKNGRLRGEGPDRRISGCNNREGVRLPRVRERPNASPEGLVEPSSA